MAPNGHHHRRASDKKRQQKLYSEHLEGN